MEKIKKELNILNVNKAIKNTINIKNRTKLKTKKLNIYIFFKLNIYISKINQRIKRRKLEKDINRKKCFFFYRIK